MGTWGRVGLLGLMLAVSLLPGCSAPDFDSAIQNSPGAPLPFDRTPTARGISPTAGLLPKEIPAGTPLTIRLQSGLSSTASRSGDSFDAILDEPIVVAGQTVAPRGAPAIGRVVSARPSGHLQHPGYLRLTLASLTVRGSPVDVQASSIFVKGGSRSDVGTRAAGDAGAVYAAGEKNVGFLPEQRLTFRLTQGLPLSR